VGPLTRVLGQHPAVQGVAGELHQGIGEAPLPAPVVALSRGTGERLQGGAQEGAPLAVEEAPEAEGAPLDGLQLQEARLQRVVPARVSTPSGQGGSGVDPAIAW
jgi:hypothetical protein